MKVLSVASECVPLIKTGGLADVVGALPAALAPQGVEMRVLLPGYPAVMKATQAEVDVLSDDDLFGGPARVLSVRAPHEQVYVLEAPHLYDRPGSIYLGPDGRDWPDNPQRFAALCWTAARIAAEGVGEWRPDVLHLHDWQAGLVPEYLRDRHLATPTVLTIHNMAFHGSADPALIPDLRLDPGRFHPDGYEAWGRVSALKAGLIGATRLTTVSPTYAYELTTPEFGMGFDGLMRTRRGALSGILNGIDETAWNPADDPAIHAYADPRGKTRNRDALREELGLPPSDGPLCVVVSRLSEQKGLDLLLQALPTLLACGGQLALLGSGDRGLESAFLNAARDPNVAVRIGYDEALSHRMIAGGDAILVPSRFEPCGLTQLYGLRYGTVPVVALTGGLADTVINASPAALAAGCATGLQFHPVTVDALRNALSRLCELFADARAFTRMQKNAMKSPVGWDGSAAAYAALYRDLLHRG
ncbi:glycogen synthase GlgA [Wenxinia marina]|uniref:Glycogen synthase n=1 Tax=Wenxinia marina DSM 24838 TaxID=1123501 RepID=A0A0D0Q610_9RHOB|nr:glycogen synthase GlgA [Wenxinia marina]KIQ69909.1 glycogen/starch synthase, ADP-glucose type [Wenxinia marina DSM 24838]GGL62144.1 glycogen synthase [Wenxinia marina]